MTLTAIDAGLYLATTGLALDIVGAVTLFYCASAKNLEREMVYKMVRHATEEAKGAEWVRPISFGSINGGWREPHSCPD